LEECQSDWQLPRAVGGKLRSRKKFSVQSELDVRLALKKIIAEIDYVKVRDSYSGRACSGSALGYWSIKKIVKPRYQSRGERRSNPKRKIGTQHRVTEGVA